jgi:REP element-mobilizing transposase RayT
MGRQLALFESRKGIGGRLPKGEKAGVPHRPRLFATGKPMHVTLKVVRRMPGLRQRFAWQAARRALSLALVRPDFRVCQVSIQRNHVHLIIEADDPKALARGMQGFQISCAKQINARLRRAGRVFADRYHAVVLDGPTQVRNVLKYVLNNWRRHGERGNGEVVDRYSSGPQFGGWNRDVRWHGEVLPVASPTSWVLDVGWRERGGGGFSPFERPGPGHEP